MDNSSSSALGAQTLANSLYLSRLGGRLQETVEFLPYRLKEALIVR